MRAARSVLAEVLRQEGLNFINGTRILPADFARTSTVTEPRTGNKVADLAASGYDDVDKAVQSAKKAFEQWSQISAFERGKYLIALGQKIKKDVEYLASVEACDSGKPIWEAREDVISCADAFEYFGGIAPTVLGQHIPLKNGSFAMICKEPFGVVGGIGAWNYPLQTVCFKVAPALACGNTIVIKPSQFTPFTAVILGELMQTVGIPSGVYNVIQGDGETGRLLCKHPEISLLSLTGSVPTGQKVMQEAAECIKPVHLELGGKSPLIIFEDADINNAVKTAILANFLSQGQVCSNGTRVFIHESIIDEFLPRLQSTTKALKIGDPLDEDTRIGAIITREHSEKILQFIQEALNEGGAYVHMPKPLENGCYIAPCILTNCTDDMRITKEEVFGPVMTILPFSEEQEVIQRANNTPYGLAAGIMTCNLQRAHRVAKKLQAGTVWINTYNTFSCDLPFGGYKLSGFGREGGTVVLDQYVQSKTVYVEMGDVHVEPLFK